MTQNFFNYHLSNVKDYDNFFVNKTNEEAFNITTNNNLDQNIFLYGPSKSGKSHLANIWKTKNDAISYKDNFNDILKSNKNVLIENILLGQSEEMLFHIINHCKSFNLRILTTSSIDLNNYSFELKDLFSRLRSFYNIKIKNPDEEMCKMIMTKLFFDKQIIIKNNDIFDYIFNRISRTYNDIYLFVEKIDKLSLEKKRQLTIPLIKEIL